MPATYISSNSTAPQLRRPYFPGHRSSYLDLIPEDELAACAKMDEESESLAPKVKSKSTPQVDEIAAATREVDETLKPPPSDINGNAADLTPFDDGSGGDYLSAGYSSFSNSGMNTPSGLSRSSSGDNGSSFDTSDAFPPVDRLTIFDILENFALPQRLERMQNAISDNAEKLRKQRAKLTSRALSQKNNLVGEWRKRVPQGGPDEQLDKYRKRMRNSVDRLNKRWDAAKTVKLNEKISFVSAVLNIFISAYLIGQFPEYFHYWYTVQLA